MKFTFKTEKATGRYRSFHPDWHHIKLEKIKVGAITDSKPHKIRLQIIKKDILEDGNPNCTWKWIQLKGRFDSIQDAKIWLNDHIDSILSKYDIYMEA